MDGSRYAMHARRSAGPAGPSDLESGSLAIDDSAARPPPLALGPQQLDAAATPVAYVDSDQRLRLVNRAWCEMVGRPREAVVGRATAEALGAQTAGRLRAAVAGESLPEVFETRERPPGIRRDYRIDVGIDHGANGETRGALCLWSDVTEAVRLDAEVLEQRRRFDLLADHLPGPIVYVDPDYRFLFVNREWSEWTGVARAAAIGRSLVDVMGPSAEPLIPLLERARGGESVEYERMVVLAGSTRRWLRGRIVGDFDLAGALRGFYLSAHDVSDLKLARDALAASEAQLRDIIDHVPSRITYLDRSLAVRFANRAALDWYGRSESELRGEPLGQLIPLERMRVVAPLFERVLAGEALSVEAEMPQAEGRMRWETLHFVPHFAGGEVRGVYAVITDVDAEKANERALRRANWMLSSHIDNTPLAVIEWDRDFRLTHWSPQAENIFGWRAVEVLGLQFSDCRLIYEEDRPAIDEMLSELASGGLPRATSLNRGYRKDGKLIWCEWYNSSLHDEQGRLLSILSFVQDVSSRIEAEERLQHLATHDSLTGLPNRVLLHERIGQAIALARRTGRRAAVLIVDLDRFKNVNDSLGHRIGDELLRQLADRLQTTIRETDSLARLGGDEFVVVVDRFDEADVVAGIAVKLLDTIAQPLVVEEHEVYMTASIGISMFPDDAGDAEEMFKNADVALYRAKESGKNTMNFFSAELAALRLRQHTIEVALRAAIKEGGLFLHYQPVVRIEDGAIAGVEALIRWRHPERGLIPPHSFIPPAEESGLIHLLGDWVLREACRQAAAWKAAGLPPITVAVNLSAKQFFQEDLAHRIEQTITAEGCDPAMIKLEVTETSILQDLEMIQRVLSRLKRFGVRVAIDDFGTGYSSLSHLRHFPIDTLKIDLSFIADLDSDAGDAAITGAIIALGRGLGLEVVAEGVESRPQLDFLRAHGCGYYQGNLFSGPLSATEVAAMIGGGRAPGAAVPGDEGSGRTS